MSAQRASWEETKLQHQQTVQMQKLKDREQAASAKQKERTQSAHDKQLVRLLLRQTNRSKTQLLFATLVALILPTPSPVVHR